MVPNRTCSIRWIIFKLFLQIESKLIEKHFYFLFYHTCDSFYFNSSQLVLWKFLSELYPAIKSWSQIEFDNLFLKRLTFSIFIYFYFWKYTWYGCNCPARGKIKRLKMDKKQLVFAVQVFSPTFHLPSEQDKNHQHHFALDSAQLPHLNCAKKSVISKSQKWVEYCSAVLSEMITL